MTSQPRRAAPPVTGDSTATASRAQPRLALSRIRLGTRLRQLREDRGLRIEDAAAALGIAPSTLSRIETGKAPARTVYLDVLADLYGIDSPDERQHLADLAKHDRNREWHPRYPGLLPAGADPCLTLETEAAEQLPGLR